MASSKFRGAVWKSLCCGKLLALLIICCDWSVVRMVQRWCAEQKKACLTFSTGVSGATSVTGSLVIRCQLTPSFHSQIALSAQEPVTASSGILRMHGDHLSGKPEKPGSVRKFETYQRNIGNLAESQGKPCQRKLMSTSCLGQCRCLVA